jgi:Protein of unknown function (DUF4232)
MKMTMLAAGAITVAATVGLPAVAHADPPPPCATGQVHVSNGGEHRASGHRLVVLEFSLAPGAQACTLTGYPGVDSGAGGPLLHADRTLSGFMGGLRTDALPTLTVSEYQPATALVEGVAVDREDPYRLCPTYTELLVTPPDTTEATTIPIWMDTCELQVHPMGTTW